MTQKIRIGETWIGEGHPTYVIAEMSANHAGDKTHALEIIHAAKEAGADCLKIQTYTADTLTIDSAKSYFQISGGTWSGENLYSLYQKAYTPWEWQGELKETCEKLGLHFLSTPFDRTAVDFLESLEVEAFKIASFEAVDIPLIRYVASKGKPIILSTGMASLGEIDEAVQAIRRAGNEQFCLLKCSSAYPAVPDDMNLRTIRHLEDTFGVPAGLSDHSMGSLGAVAAVAAGAKIIEKHFCISREIENPDASFSMEPDEFSRMVREIRTVEKALGSVSYEVSAKEEASRIFRKSIFVVADIHKGEPLTEANVRVIRPGYGLSPKHYDAVLGKIAAVDISRGEPLKWSMVEP